MSDTSSALQLVRFGDDQLQATRLGETVWVSVPAVCNALGIKVNRQRQKLAGASWARSSLMGTPSAGGQQETFCLDLEVLPMWLATISETKVSAEAKPKIVRYQRECAKVLREHFFGPTKALTSIQMLVLQAQAMLEMEQRATAVEAKTDALAQKVEVLGNHIEQDVGYCVVSARNDRHHLSDVDLHLVGKIATRLCTEQGLKKRSVQGTRYPIGCYPIHIVDQAFKAFLMGTRK